MTSPTKVKTNQKDANNKKIISQSKTDSMNSNKYDKSNEENNLLIGNKTKRKDEEPEKLKDFNKDRTMGINVSNSIQDNKFVCTVSSKFKVDNIEKKTVNIILYVYGIKKEEIKIIEDFAKEMKMKQNNRKHLKDYKEKNNESKDSSEENKQEPEKICKINKLSENMDSLDRILELDLEGGRTVQLNKDDLYCLYEGEYLNDSIIYFYLKFLEISFKPRKSQSFTCFNTFFYFNLNRHIDRKSKFEKIDQYDLFKKKYTKNIDIFSYDYMIFPIHLENHWSLLIIYQPYRIFHIYECIKENKDVVMSPFVIYLDSFYGENEQCIKIFTNFLILETLQQCDKAFIADNYEEIIDCILNYTPVAPRQTNKIDCGLYLMVYSEMFIINSSFIIETIDIKQDYTEWFSVDFVNQKRKFIFALINELKISKAKGIEFYLKHLENNAISVNF